MEKKLQKLADDTWTLLIKHIQEGANDEAFDDLMQAIRTAYQMNF